MHACESFFARPYSQVPERPILYQGSNPFSRGLSLEAFGFIWRSYRRAVSDGHHRGARLDMSTGSHLAGLAFSHSGLGLVHALASAVGGMVDAPHGVCLAACTNIGLRYNFKACEKDYAILANSMCEIDETDASNAGGEVFLKKLQDLIEELGFPLQAFGTGARQGGCRETAGKHIGPGRDVQKPTRGLSMMSFSPILKMEFRRR